MHWYWWILIGYFGADAVNYYVRLNILDHLVEIGKLIVSVFRKKAAA